MKKLNFKSLILALTLLTIGTGQMWADSSVKGGDVYFDAGGSGWSVDNVQYVVGHSSYSTTEYGMTAVENTLLYYYSSPSWNDASYFAFASGTGSWGGEGQSWSARCAWATKSTTEKSGYGLNSGNVYVFKSDGTGTCDGVGSDSPYGWLGSSYTSLNKTITVAAKISTDGGANYISAASPGTLSASSYSFTSNGNNCKNPTSLSDGTITCGYTANTTLTAGAATGYTIMGWYDEDGEKLCNNGGTINPREDATVYAYYKLNQYTVSYGVNSSTRWGSITLNAGSAVTTTSSSTLNHGTAIAFTASPNSGYQVEGWYSDAACAAKDRLQSGGTSYNAGTLTAATTVYVKFEVRTGGTVTLTAGTGGQVSLDNSNWGASKAKSEITTATAFNIYAQASTGYTFSAWAKSSGSGTITSTSSASTSFTPVAYEDATVTASFTQNMSSITTSNHYDVGDPKYSVPSKSVSSIGIATTADLTATTPSTGYRFVGWTLSNNIVVTSGDKDTDLSITIRTNGNGAAATAQANYEEDLTSTYYLVGNNTSVFPGDATWTASDSKNMLRKASGSSTGSVGSITINVKSIPANSSDYQFKIHESSANKWWGWSNDTYYWMDYTKTTSLYNNQHNLYFIPNALGDYTFSTDWSNADEPSLTVTFPATTYTVNFGQGAGTEGTASATYSSTSFSTGTKVQDGKSITLTAPSASSGYSWDGWYNASSGGTRVSTNNTYTTTVSSTNHDFYARYTEATYTVAFNDGDHGSVSPRGDQQVGAGGKSITASPSTGYMFSSWSKTGNDVSLSSTSTNPTTVTAAGTGSVTANYEQRFVLRGSTRAADATTAGMAGWSATNNDSYSSFSVAGNVITIEASLNASTEYKFKIWDKQLSAWRGQNGSSSMTDGATWTFDDDDDVYFTTTFAGTYTFDIDVSTATAPSVTLTYPLAHTLTYSIGSVSGTSGSISTSPSTASGSLVEDGHEVTLTAPAAKTGYQWKGWYTNAAGTEGKIADVDRAITLTMNADKTVYACYEAKTYTVTLDHEGGSSGPSNPTVTYDAKPTDLASIPTKAGFGFDGYWTEDDGNGIQVIDGTGKWLSNVEYNTDASGNWIHDGDQKYYAKWLAVGYYVVGGPGLDNWVTKPSKLFSGSPLTLELALNKSSFESNEPTLTAQFKIREVKAGASSTDVWFGKGASDGEVSFGKYNPTEEDLNTSGHNMQLEVYYNGTYTFKITNIDATPNIDLTVEVPVIDQLQIYSGCDGTVDAYYNWDGAPVENVVSKTVTLDNCTGENGFYFKAVFDSEYYGKNSTTITRASSSASGLSTSGGNIKIETDVKGDYTFKFNTSTHALNVLYPTKRQVNYSAVTLNNGTGESAAPTATNDGDGDEAVANGGYVADGYSVTFHAKTANTGYTFRGWFSKNNPSNWSDGLLEDDADYTATISDNTTVYAVYSEDDITVTVNATTGGSITTPAAPAETVTAHPATGVAIVAALADASWYFTGWTVTSGTASFGDASALSTTVTASAAATVQANFARRYELRGSLTDNSSDAGMPGWGDNDAVFTGTVTSLGVDDGVNLTCTRVLYPNAAYIFVIHDRKTNKNMGYSPAFTDIGDQSFLLDDQDNEVVFYTAGRGSYTFKITKLSNDANQYPTVKLERQASHLVSIGQGYEDIDGTIHTNSSTGGTMAAEATESGTTIAITNGKYIANGGKLEWSVTPATGYTLGHYYGSSSLTGDSFDFTEIDPVNAAANVYAKFVETATTVTIEHNEHGHVTVGGETATSTTVGITTTRALVAVPDAGYYFAGWTIEGLDIELQDKSEDENAEVTLHGLGAGIAATLTANFVELDKIYFRNIDESTGNRLWNQDHIYVYFGTTWANSKGVQTLTNYAEMSPALGTKIYWAYVPHAFTKSNNTHVAFSDVDMHTNNEFYNNHGVYREDYNKALNMFVPNRTSSGTTNGTVYHSNGFWKVYDPQVGKGQGYYLQLHTGDDGEGHGNYDQKGEFTATGDGATTIEYTMRVDNTSTQTQYRIASAGGVHYTASATITSAACENVIVNEYQNCSNCYFTVTPTSEGDYKFIIDQDGDQMHITIDYPVSVGDYRLKHTYLGKKRTDPTVDSTYCTYSDVIKSSGASTPRTLSMYLNTAGDDALVLQKCTAIVAGSPAWDAGDATNLAGVLTTVGTNGNGVYQFDVAVSADKVASAPTATKYTGPYYIKTDGATGGWANYTLNSMSENTLNYDTEQPEKSFNYYYCKYYNDAGRNLKCIIANDYCNALTDTLKGDDVIGAGNQTTPSAVSVRFSYNSYTNKIQRSYLGASLTSDFLRIEGNTTASKPHIYDKDETTFDDSHADAYITFVDKQNWRYEIDVKADVNARAKLTAAFNGTTQYFWGHAGEVGHEWDDENTSQLFGGNSGTYGLTLIYDFKTNNLISAWKPTGGTIEDDLNIQSDVILLREHQEAPTTITFAKKGGSGDYASITDVKTVYGVLRLNRWKLNNRAHPEDVDPEHCKTADLINTHHAALNPGDAGYLPQAERELYFISFPFDVQMSDIISFSTYYTTWGIMYYDGKNRAKNGYWIDSESNWKYFTPAEYATKKLNAYEGYLIGIDLSAMRYNNTDFWTNNSSEVDIYFPSRTEVSSITQQAVDVTIDQTDYLCTINRDYGGNDGDRRIKDSYWHCIGVPAYANLDHAITGSEPTNWDNTSLLYLYEWDTETNEHSIKKASTYSFQAMYAYLVQYAGTTLSWEAAAAGPAPTPVAARRLQTEELRDRQFNLQLLQGNKEADHTYIRLSADEEVTSGFEFNHDVSKMMHSKANIYTLIGTEQAAANSLPLDMEQTTVVPVGVRIKTAGEYTFSMPDGTDGIGVTLIDNVSNTHTNLALGDYTVSLPAGTIDNRFSLSISPIQQAPTGLEAIERQAAGEGARKVMVDGILYILRDGKVYDAQGRRAQ